MKINPPSIHRLANKHLKPKYLRSAFYKFVGKAMHGTAWFLSGNTETN